MNAVPDDEHRDLFKGIVDELPLGIIVFSKAGVHYINQAATIMAELAPVNVAGWSVDQILAYMHPDDAPVLLKNFRDRLAGEITTPLYYAARMKDASGMYHWMELFSTSMVSQGEVLVIVSFIDRTEQRTLQDDLKQAHDLLEARVTARTRELARAVNKVRVSEAKFRDVFENAPSGLAYSDKNGFVIEINDESRRIFGYAETASPACVNIFTLPFAPDSFISAVRAGKKVTYDWQVDFSELKRAGIPLSRDGRADLLIKGFKARDGGYFFTIDDVSELVHDRILLMETEARHRLITENVTDLITIIDERLIIDHVNEIAHVNLLRMGEQDLVGRPVTDMIHDDDKAAFISFCKAGTTAEFRVVTSRGDVSWIEVARRPFRDVGGRERVMLVSRDVSARKTVEVMLQKENEQLRALAAMRQQFISNATHELKTPLISVYTGIDFLLKAYKQELGPNAADLIKTVEGGARRLKQLVDDMLDSSALDLKRVVLQREPVLLHALVDEAIAEVTFYMARHGHERVEVDVPLDTIVHADKGKIKQVLVNFLTNASKNTPAGRKIAVSARKVNDSARVSVIDEGIGLTGDEMHVLFTQFGKVTRDTGNINIDETGTGLGLFIVKEIVTLHGGKVSATSAGRDAGATFTMELPLDAGMP